MTIGQLSPGVETLVLWLLMLMRLLMIMIATIVLTVLAMLVAVKHTTVPHVHTRSHIHGARQRHISPADVQIKQLILIMHSENIGLRFELFSFGLHLPLHIQLNLTNK